MKAFVLSSCALLVLVASGIAQEDFTAVHREDFARWAQLTGLSPAGIHRMWRSTSHYASEADDDSSIDLVDVSSLRSRKQILMVTSAGLPRCVTVAVFSSQSPAFRKVWQAEQAANGSGFCDMLGSPAAVNVAQSGDIEITVAVPREETNLPEVHAYTYRWDGSSYRLDTNVPPPDRPKRSPNMRDRR